MHHGLLSHANIGALWGIIHFQGWSQHRLEGAASYTNGERTPRHARGVQSLLSFSQAPNSSDSGASRAVGVLDRGNDTSIPFWAAYRIHQMQRAARTVKNIVGQL